jgi:hypothetical protein
MKVCQARAQTFFVQENGSGNETIIKKELQKRLITTTELSAKADFIIKIDIDPATFWKRGKTKLILISQKTGKIIYETPTENITAGSIIVQERSIANDVPKLTKKYAEQLILASKKEN